MPHLGSDLIRRGVFALALAVVAALVSTAVDSGASHATHVTGMDAMSIDTNVAGNDGDTLASNDSCVSANPGASFTVDVTARNIPVGIPITAFGATMNYDADTFTITASDAAYILGMIVGSSVANFSEVPPDSDGEFFAAALDTDATKAEYGSGVLIRITIEVNAGANTGNYPLTLTAAGHGDPENHYFLPAIVNDANIAVGQACPTAFGDVDCGGSVTSVDSLKVLRFNAGLSVSQTEPCVDIGSVLPNSELQGDVDCGDTVNSVDALKLLRYGAGLSVAQNDPCPDVGTQGG